MRMKDTKTLYFDGTFVKRCAAYSSEYKKFAVSNDLDTENNKNQVKFLMELNNLFRKYSISSVYVDRNRVPDPIDGEKIDPENGEYVYTGCLVFVSNDKKLRLTYMPRFCGKPDADYEYWNPTDGFLVTNVIFKPTRTLSVVKEVEEDVDD
jgi:hypothetical protein